MPPKPTMLLIKSGTLVTHEGSAKADILIEGETIREIGSGLKAPDAEVVNAAGKLGMPGGVDPHTHFDLEMFSTVTADDHCSGHKAAPFGGTTTVIDFVPQPPSGPLRSGVEAWHAKAGPKAAVDWGFPMNITPLGGETFGGNPPFPA